LTELKRNTLAYFGAALLKKKQKKKCDINA